MKLTKESLTLLTLTAAIPFIAGMLLRGSAQTTSLNQDSPTAGDDSTQVKIARAMSAGPMNVAKAARIIDTDAQGKLVVLREGSNGFTCMPGNLKVVGEPPIMECVQRNQSDLLVLGLHRHSLLFSRLCNHTTHDLVQQLSSSVLGVH